MKRKFAVCLLLILALTLLMSPAALATDEDGDAAGNYMGQFQVDVGSNGEVHVGTGSSSTGSVSDSIAAVIGNYKEVAALILGVCVITSIIALMIAISRLGTSGDNERARANAIRAVAFSGLALAIFGSASIVIGAFWNALG